ncbi:hypothetical protein [Streptomyces sp. SCUT-3]|uniref:hypothetical protein n=1 Tax=Streptomyces sp. SCUT-3 TaxID=2684469 RepID=UPI0021756467|nr:hypothetical protein [Streptomyces sp. SCUT-3]
MLLHSRRPSTPHYETWVPLLRGGRIVVAPPASWTSATWRGSSPRRASPACG